MVRAFAALAAVIMSTAPVRASEADALAISANITARHLPFGTILDPILASSTSTQIIGYTRCGDSALWTGAWLAAEAFRYKVTQSADALTNVKTALAGLKLLSEVTGDNRLARCVVDSTSPYAAGIQNEEAANTIHPNPPLFWVDNTSRDEVVGAFFGLGAAFDLVDDAGVKSGISDVATRLLGFISRHQWSPNDDLSNTFLIRPEELQMLLQVARHINPSNGISGPLIVLPVNVGVLVDVNDNASYFKFNLDFMTFYHLIRYQDNGDNRAAYQTVRNYTSAHQNAFFDIIDRAIRGPDVARDQEMANLLAQWLMRSNRDFGIDNSKQVAMCGQDACAPIAVPVRVPTDFLWQRSPFQLAGGGSGVVESAGIDYILPYWMARYYGVIASGNAVQSAAAPTGSVAPSSLASLFGANLAPGTAQAGSQPLPTSLGGVTISVKDAAGVLRSAPLIYVSPGQINFELPDGTAAGAATLAVAGAGSTQMFTGTIQPVLPTLFSMNGNGMGVAAALAVAVQAANPRLQNPVAVFQCSNGSCVPVPIVLGVDTPVYVSFYGTGIRNASSMANVSLTIAGQTAPLQYAGPAPGFAGLDQINVAIPLSLRGRGLCDVILTVDGQASNVVTIDIQ